MDLQRRNYQAVILAGGLGERLKPITEKIPKPMVDIHGKPFLQLKLEHLAHYGIKDIILCVEYLGKIIEDHFSDGKKFGLSISYVRGSKDFGTGGAIKNAESLIRGDFIAMNGDTYAPFNITDFISFHEQHKKPITLLTTPALTPLEQELLHLSKETIIEIYKRGTNLHAHHLSTTQTPLANGGHYVINRKVLDYIPRSQNVSLENNIFPLFKGDMTGFFYQDYFKDIGTNKSLDEFLREVAYEVL